MNHPRGFTLIELIVAIAIVALITAAAAISLREYRFRAEVSAVASELAQLETAFKAHRQFEQETGWPHHVGFNLPDVRTIINNGHANFANFKDYFIGDMSVFESSLYVEYYFDQSDSYRCSGANFERSGVNILLNPENVSTQYHNELFDRINTKVDGDDPTTGCGKVRLQDVGGYNVMYYNIASSTFGY